MDEQEVHEPQLPTKSGMAAFSKELWKKDATVQGAKRALEKVKRWREQVAEKVAAAEARLAAMREARRICAAQYQQAVLESADFLGAEEAQRVQGLLASLQEVLEEEAKSGAGKAVQAAAGAVEVMDEGADDAAGAGAPGRVKRRRQWLDGPAWLPGWQGQDGLEAQA